MHFVVGLGNPGKEYVGTRHNLGFEVVQQLAERHGFPSWRRFKNADIARGSIEDAACMLVKPLTYMNLSGDAVSAILSYHEGSTAELIVVHDELDFDPGTVRVKAGGGHGGHNGLRSIMAHLGRDFVRIRIGVGKPPAGRGVDHVLGRFSKADRERAGDGVALGSEAVELILGKGLQAAMNRINGKPKDTEDDRSIVATHSEPPAPPGGGGQGGGGGERRRIGGSGIKSKD